VFIFLFIFIDISLFALLSFPFYKLLCGEEFLLLFDSFPLRLTKISISPIWVEILLLDDFLCTNSFFSLLFYNFIFCDLSVYEFCFLFLHFVIYNIGNISNYSDLSFEVFLYTRRTSIGLIEFYSLQRSVIMFFDELGLVFFRLYNPLNHAYINFLIYLVYPLVYSVYVHKIQCFCFESIVINSFEVLDLPVLFSISSDIRFEWMFSFCRLALLYIHFAG